MSEKGTYTPASLDDPLTITVDNADPGLAFSIGLDNLQSGDALEVTTDIDGSGTITETYTIDDVTAGDKALNSLWFSINAGQVFTLTLKQTTGTLRTWPYNIGYQSP